MTTVSDCLKTWEAALAKYDLDSVLSAVEQNIEDGFGSKEAHVKAIETHIGVLATQLRGIENQVLDAFEKQLPEEYAALVTGSKADGVTRATAGGMFGVNGEWYNGGEFLPSDARTNRGEFSLNRPQGFVPAGEPYFDKDQNQVQGYTKFADGTRVASIETGHVGVVDGQVGPGPVFKSVVVKFDNGTRATMLSKDLRPEAVKAPVVAPPPVAPPQLSPTEQALADAGLTIDKRTSRQGKDFWSVSGNLDGNKDVLDRLGFAAPYSFGKVMSRSKFDADPTEKLVAALTGNEAPVKTLGPEEAKKVLERLGIFVDQSTKDWQVRGKTFDHRALIRNMGGKPVGSGKAFHWVFYRDPTAELAAALAETAELPPESSTVEVEASDAEKAARAAQLKKEMSKADERIDNPGELVGDDTKALIQQGEKIGIPQEIIDEQVDDIGMAVNAYQKKKTLFLLANMAGTGKTYVLGGIIKELRKLGEKKFVYVTMNTDLIKQIQGDLKAYGVDDVKFHTYAELSTGKLEIEDAQGAITIYDEAHNIKKVGEETARADKAQKLMEASKMTILSSATLFENPVEARYLAATGVFDAAGGFTEWAKTFGASVRIRKFFNPKTGRQQEEEIIYWAGGKKEHGAAARLWLFKQGVMTQRAMRIDPNKTDVIFRRNPVTEEWVQLYDKVVSAYQAVIDAHSTADGEPIDKAIVTAVGMHRENVIKRVLEASKIEMAIADAKEVLATPGEKGQKRAVVIFVETKADRFLGKWRRSEHFKDNTLYSFEEVVEFMAEWEQEAGMARMMGERPPPRPFASFIVEIARQFDRDGILQELPSAPDQIKAAFPGDVAEYTGAVTTAAALKNKTDFMAGKKSVLVATMAKGGTGLSLHDVVGNRPTTQININLPWRATGVDQVAARTARYGLASKSEVRWMFASNIPWESEKLAPRIGARMRDMGAIIRGISINAADKLEGDFNFEGDVDVKGGNVIELPLSKAEAPRAKTGLSVESVQRIADNMSLGKKINVVNTQADLPDSAKNFKSDINTNLRGLYIPSTDEIYVIASNVDTLNNLADTLLHEGMHRGMRKLFGADLVTVLNRIWMGNENVRIKTEARMKITGESKLLAIEEVLARMAGEGTAAKLVGWDALVDFVKTWIRNFASSMGATLEFTDDMVLALVAEASKAGLQDDKAAIPYYGKANESSLANRHLPQLARYERGLLPAERDKLREDTANRLVDLIKQLPSANEMASVAYAGKAKRGWYRKSGEAIASVFGPDATRFTALLAAMSPRNSVEFNFENALRVWGAWVVAGRPQNPAKILALMGQSVIGGKGEGSVMGTWRPNSILALTTNDPVGLTLSGPKVDSFYKNLMGAVDEVTNDAWIATFAAVSQTLFKGQRTETDAGKGPGYLAMSHQVRRAAAILTEQTGELWTPAEVQETIWSWTKTAYEFAGKKGETRSVLELIRSGAITDAMIASTPDFRTLFNDTYYTNHLLNAGYETKLRRAGFRRTIGSPRQSDEGAGSEVAGTGGEAGAFAPNPRHLENAARRLDRVRAERGQVNEGIEDGPLASQEPGFSFDASTSHLYLDRASGDVGAVTEAQATQALQTDATARRILAKGNTIEDGQRVGVRLNINVLKNTGVPVQTVHAGKTGEGYKENRGWWGGEVLTYQSTVTLRNAFFNVHQAAREKIASGVENKSPMASVDGEFSATEPNFAGVEFHFNPKREHLFVDANGHALRSAEEVTINGNRAFARGQIEYYGNEDVPTKVGSAPSRATILAPTTLSMIDRKENLDPLDAEAEQVQAGIEGKSLVDAAKWIADNAPKKMQLIAAAVHAKLKELEGEGKKFSLRVIHVGDTVPVLFLGSRGMVSSTAGGPEIKMLINGKDVTGKVGVSYSTVLHELIHAATSQLMAKGRSLPDTDKSDLNIAITDFVKLQNTIVRHFNERVNSGALLTEFEQSIHERLINAMLTMDETLAWALTDSRVQDYLEGIPYQGGNLWTHFVAVIRQVLGLPATADTALSEVLRLAESLLKTAPLATYTTAELAEKTRREAAAQAEEDKRRRAALAPPPPSKTKPMKGQIKDLFDTQGDLFMRETAIGQALNIAYDGWGVDVPIDSRPTRVDIDVTEPMRIPVPPVQVGRRLTTLVQREAEGKISKQNLEYGVWLLAKDVEAAQSAKAHNAPLTTRARGYDWIRERLAKAVRLGELSREAVEFAMWAIQRNPQLAEGLAISFDADMGGAAGNYQPLYRMMTLSKASARETTVVHEILHHAERMMTPEMQDEVRAAWAKAFEHAYVLAVKDKNTKLVTGLDFIMEVMAEPTKKNVEKLGRMFSDGTLDIDLHYQLTNPSEYWAVNATRVMGNKYLAGDSTWGKIRIWMMELQEKIIDLLFDLDTDAKIIKALKQVTSGEGDFLSKSMLTGERGGTFNDLAGVTNSTIGAKAGIVKKEIQRTGIWKALQTLFQTTEVFNVWDRTLGTPMGKAKKDEDYARVYDAIQQEMQDSASYAMESETQAPNILQRLLGTRDGFGSLVKTFVKGSKDYDADMRAVSKAVFANIEGKPGIQSKYFNDQELARDYSLNERQIGMYQEFRNSIDQSIDRLAQTVVMKASSAFIEVDQLRGLGLLETVDEANVLLGFAQGNYETALRGAQAKEKLQSLQVVATGANPGVLRQDAIKTADEISELTAKIEALGAAVARNKEIRNWALHLQATAYAPAMRFGNYFVKVWTDNESEPDVFVMFENEKEANVALIQLRRDYPASNVEAGNLNRDEWKMFKGISPETAELFAQFMGADETAGFKEYIALAKSSRSAMKRMLQRGGVPGFTWDTSRVLAQFITSNARQASQNVNGTAINEAMSSKTLKAKGDVQQDAQKLLDYVQNPAEEASGFRGLMFMHFMGGSIASALSNMTQPILQTFPHLNKYIDAKTLSKIMVEAGTMAANDKKITDPGLRRALEIAAQQGTTQPHEIHQLMAEAQGSAFGKSHRAQAAAKLWSSFFALSEAFNRRQSFIAAYMVAEKAGVQDAGKFAKEAVNTTQGAYNKGNRPNWSRGTIGASVMTFKQFSIAYIEFLVRLPLKQQMLALGILVLLAGLEGLPFAEDLEDIIDTVGARLGYGTNTKKFVTKFFKEWTGDYLGGFLLHGLSGIPGSPISVSARLGLHNLIPGTRMLHPSNTNKANEVLEWFGAPGGFAKGVVEAFTEGKVAPALPTAFRNAYHGAKMAWHGELRDSNDKKISDASLIDAGFKAIGFQGGGAAIDSRDHLEKTRDVELHRYFEAKIADEWAWGIFRQDQDIIDSAKAKLAAWNERSATSPIQIGVTQLSQRVRNYRETRAERFARTTPTEMRAEFRNA